MSGVVWITGLPGVGKTSLALKVADNLRANGLPVFTLDGDDMRRALGVHNSHYDSSSRRQLAMLYADHALSLAASGQLVVASVVALFHDARRRLRQANLPYLEVWLRAPEMLRQERAGDANAPPNLRVGLGVDVEFPCAPDMALDNDGDVLGLDDLATQISNAWINRYGV
jgi:cytidine diphosphoramidate kinase